MTSWSSSLKCRKQGGKGPGKQRRVAKGEMDPTHELPTWRPSICGEAWGSARHRYLHEGSHQSSREVEVRHVGDQAGVVMVDVRRALSPHVRGLPVEAVGRRAEVRVLGPTPRRVLVDPRVRHAVAGVVVRGSHFCKTETALRPAGKSRAGQSQQTCPAPSL